MPRRVATLAFCIMLAQAVGLASGPQTAPGTASGPPVADAGIIRAAVAREAKRLALEGSRTTPSWQQTPDRQRGWIACHPVAFGALVGAGGGAAAGATLRCNVHKDDCSSPTAWVPVTTAVGAGIGAGLGALVGLIVVAVR